MGTLFQDLRYAFRTLARSPGFTAVVVLTLALGIGANTAIFSLINAVLLRPLPVPDPDRLVKAYQGTEKYPYQVLSYPNYTDIREHGDTFSGLSAHHPITMHLSSEGYTERLQGELVSGNYFDVLGVKPALGRSFLPEEDESPSTHSVAVISHCLWERLFDRDPDVLGREVRINSFPFTVIGVAPQGFKGVEIHRHADIWLPMMMLAQAKPGRPEAWLNQRGARWLDAIGRLKAGINVEQAQERLNVLSARLQREFPETNQDYILTVAQGPLHPYFQRDIATYLGILMAAVGVVLLIACTNVANLLITRTARRSREVAIRLAVGSSSWRLIRYLLTESLVLSALGSLAALLLAVWTYDLLRLFHLRYIAVADLDLSLDVRVFAFTLGLATLTGILYGLAPGFRASRIDLVSTLKEAGEGRGSARLGARSLLVISEVALCLVLLVVAGLLLRTLASVYAIDPGFDPEDVLLASVDVKLQGYSEGEGKRFHRDLLERAAQLPGVESVSLAHYVPVAPDMRAGPVYIEGREESSEAETNFVGPHYFQTMRIPLLRGRDFDRQDSEGNRAVAIVNEVAARRFWPGEDPIGKRIRVRAKEPFREIVGVAREVKYHELRAESLRSVQSGAYVYLPVFQDYQGQLTVLIRSGGVPPEALLPVLRREIRELDPDLPIFDVMTLTERLNAAMAQERTSATLLGSFSLLALILAAVGLYGVIAYSVTQRTHEIGIRMALGADRSEVRRMVVGQAMTLVLIGMALGTAGALAAARVLKFTLYGVSPADPVTFITVPVLLALIAMLACLIPARRASKVDPMVTLRYE